MRAKGRREAEIFGRRKGNLKLIIYLFIIISKNERKETKRKGREILKIKEFQRFSCCVLG